MRAKFEVLNKVVLLQSYRGWIMEAIARESANAIKISPKVRYIASGRRELVNPRILVNTLIIGGFKDSLFLGYESYLRARKIGQVSPESCNLYFTHQNQIPEHHDFEKFSKILVMNEADKRLLTSYGANSERIQIVFGAIDKSIFYPSSVEAAKDLKQRTPYVLITSDCKPRKNPELILEVISAMPHLDFIIHGKGWREFLSHQNSDLSNLKILEFNLEMQPLLMRNAHAFLSLSVIEGGPYPLIEALASGTPALVTATGFANDFINDENGYVIAPDLRISAICELLNETVRKKQNLFGLDLTNRNLSWGELGTALYSR